MRGPCRRRAVNAMAPPRKRPSRRARRPAPPALQLPQTETLLHLGGAKFVTEAVRATYEPMPFILGAMKRLNFSLLRALAALAALASVAAGAFVGPVKFVGCGSGCGGRHMPPRARARADACTPQRRLVVCAVGADGAAQEGSSAVDAMEFCLIDSGNFKRLEQFGPLRVQVGLPLTARACGSLCTCNCTRARALRSARARVQRGMLVRPRPGRTLISFTKCPPWASRRPRKRCR